MLGIEAHGAAVQEVPVNEALDLVGLQHGVGHAEQERPCRWPGDMGIHSASKRGRSSSLYMGSTDDELRAGGLGLPVVRTIWAAADAPGRVAWPIMTMVSQLRRS